MPDFNWTDDALSVADRWMQTHPSSDYMSLCMDIAAADGVNGNAPLDLARLLEVDTFNFNHDIAGIMRHIDRETGTLGDCFVPRCAMATS